MAVSLLDAVRSLREALGSLRDDWQRMPFFVRPMVKAGFERRTGRNLDGWEEALRAVERDAAAGRPPSGATSLASSLDALAESFRSAPERAGKFMPGGLDQLRRRSQQREQAARDLAAALRAA